MNKKNAILYILLFIIHVINITQCKFAHRRLDAIETSDDLPDAPSRDNGLQQAKYKLHKPPESDDDIPDGPSRLDGLQEAKDKHDEHCWIKLKGHEHFEKMNKLEQKYKDVREAYAKDIDTNDFNLNMLNALQKTRGIAERALQNFGGDDSVIPAGLNLGSNCMMRMPGSIMFFYRLKLRNDTRFVVNHLYNDVKQLTLVMRLSLNDLHLVGEYERALTAKEDPSRLYYRPTKGGVEFLLKDVKYKVEGRYRLLGDRLHIEHIISEIPPMEILMRYMSDAEGKSTSINPDSIKDYLLRMKNDLDQWLKDYFNDFLMLYGLKEVKLNNKIQEYENERTILLNQYSDEVIETLNKRLRTLGDANLLMPDFMLTAANGMEIKLFDGAVRNVDTMYRRSVTTGKLDGQETVRRINTDIGFSGLKVEYRYDTYTKTGLPPLSGMLVLNSDDVSAHLALQVVDYDQGTEDLLIDYLRYGKPEMLTVEGPANRIISNFKHLLEHHIITIMTSAMIHHIRTLSSLVQCHPEIAGIDKPKEESSDNNTPADVVDNHDDASQESKDSDVTPPSSDGKENVITPPSSDSKEQDLTPTAEDSKTDGEKKDNDLTQGSQDDKSSDGSQQPQESKDADLTPPSQDDKSSDTTQVYPDSHTDDEVHSNDDDDVNPQDTQVDDPNELKPDYAFVRKESIELELPPKPGSAKGETLKLDHNETFTLTKLNTDDGDNAKLRAGVEKAPKEIKAGEKANSTTTKSDH